MRLDLHIHTTASDGAWSPQAVVEGAAAGRLDVVAIADHDTTAAVEAAREAAAPLNVQVVPALEMSSTHDGREVHVLGYFVDVHAEALVSHGGRSGRLRVERMKEMLERLAAAGVDVRYEDVAAAAGPERSSIGRPHLARALVALGYAESVPDAFDRLIGDDRPAFVPTRLQTPAQAIETILSAGGIPVWAHPPADLVGELLPGMIRAGLRGLEVYRPTHRRNQVLRLEEICKTTGLLKSGGSDWHTPEAGAALGDFHVGADEVEGLLAAGGL